MKRISFMKKKCNYDAKLPGAGRDAEDRIEQRDGEFLPG
jgi:hypothetical protein